MRLMRTAQQFICKNCKALASVDAFQHMPDGTPYCRCPECGAKNAVVETGASPSQPGILPVTRLLD
jgi:DNA-directed RNA polymerase subunit RPC12/RpoP